MKKLKKKVVIVGGVAGGASAAARLRRLDEEVEIILIERGGYISYANCGLPYYIGDVIAERDDLFVQTPHGLRARYNIEVRTRHEVLKINRQRNDRSKEVVSGRVYQETYDILLPPLFRTLRRKSRASMATMSLPCAMWPIRMDQNYLRDHQPQRALVVGRALSASRSPKT